MGFCALDPSECFSDGAFIMPKKEVDAQERPSGERCEGYGNGRPF
jgi:hypothetical protein